MGQFSPKILPTNWDMVAIRTAFLGYVRKRSERISRILEVREFLMSIQTGFNLLNAAVVCAILESISGLKPSLVITSVGT